MFFLPQMRGETHFFNYHRVIYETEAFISLTACVPLNNEIFIFWSIGPKSGTKHDTVSRYNGIYELIVE